MLNLKRTHLDNSDGFELSEYKNIGIISRKIAAHGFKKIYELNKQDHVFKTSDRRNVNIYD